MESYESNLGYEWDPFMGGGSNPKDPGMSFNLGLCISIILISIQYLPKKLTWIQWIPTKDWDNVNSSDRVLGGDQT